MHVAGYQVRTMTRLLVPIRTGLASGKESDQGFLSRLGKFIPSESGTLFTVVNAYLADELGPKPPAGSNAAPPDLVPFLGISYSGWTLIIFVICFFGNIILLNRMYDVQFAGDRLKGILKFKHISASSIGFVIWAYAIKSPFFAPYYKSFIAFLAIGLFLIIVGRIKPPVEDRPNPVADNPLVAR
jgi:hypothetical protein